MHEFTTWVMRFALLGLATGGLVVACQHEVPGPVVSPTPSEAPPMGPRPDIIKPGGATVPLTSHRKDAGSGTPIKPGPVSVLEQLGAIPAAANTLQVDAGVDGGVTLPPVPDAAVLPDSSLPPR